MEDHAFSGFVQQYMRDLATALEDMDVAQLQDIAEILGHARLEGRRIFIIGNGGSALTASHLATDLGKGASFGRRRRFRVMALTESIGIMTALANDVDYSDIFVEQLRNAAEPGDVLICFSGSGNSENVIRAAAHGDSIDMTVVAFTGGDGGRLAQMAEHVWFAPSKHMGRIEDVHMVACHILGYYFMELGD